jgi:hypothetical protein
MVKKRNRTKVVILVAIAVFTTLIVAAIVFANFGMQARPLTEGDVFTYSVKGLWESNDPNATVSDELLQLNMTEWYRVTITNISDPEVSIHTVWRLTNGTEIENNGKVDIETGVSTGGFWAIYAANLDAGKIAHPTGPEPVTIESTVNRGYTSGERETNLLTLTAQFQNKNDPSLVYTDYRIIQFDKQTGMLVELRNETTYNRPELTETILWKIIDSNVWAVT